MTAKKQLHIAAIAIMSLFASCQKDLVKEEDQVYSETISSEANAADALPETSPPIYNSVVTNVGSNSAGFWQALPARYGQTTKKYPFILFLHGIGELGTNLSRMNCCGLPNHLYNKTFPAEFVVNGTRHSFIVMAPQFKKRATPADVQTMIDFAKKRWRIDESRIYVVGLSLGGGSTWDFSAVYGQNAAAIVPVCGGTKPTTSMAQNIAKKNLPVWGLYSTADKAVPSQWGVDFFRWIDQFNSAFASKTKLTMWNDADHNTTWARAFNPKTVIDGYNIYQWMLLHRRGTASPAPSPAPVPRPGTNKAPVANAGRDQTVPASWKWFPELNGNVSKDSDGWITKYVWTKISGPACNITHIVAGRAKVTNWTSGTYVFRVTVTDNKGATAYDDVKITIGPGASPSGNMAPVANAGTDKSVPKSWKWFPELNGNFSKDSDGWITKYVWSKVSGPACTLTSVASGRARVSGYGAGTYTFRVTVTDNKGAVSTDDVRITITNN